MSDFEIENTLNNVGFICMQFKGTSMLPIFKENRDKVCINKYDKNYQLKKGDIVLYKRNDNTYVLHRLMDVLDCEYVFCGDNHYEFEYGITDKNILGVCVGYYKYNKYIDFKKSKKYKLYKNTYCKSMFIRRICKFFLRISNKIKNVFSK